MSECAGGMGASEPYSGRLTTLEAALTAERLLAAFDNEDGTFGGQFYAADRDVVGALVAYASLAIRGIAYADNTTTAIARGQLRLLISGLQSTIDQGDNNDD